MKKKKRFSALKLLIVILCITSVIVSAGINILFAGDKTPKLFDRYIYVVGEDNPMEGEITTGAALISMDAKKHGVVATGDIILCYPADNPSTLSLRSVSFISEGDEGTSYYTMDSFHEDTTGAITFDKIVAICTGYNESLELGRFITFARQLKGIIALLGVPALLLIILLFTSILGSRSDEDIEDDYDDEYDDISITIDMGGRSKTTSIKNFNSLYIVEKLPEEVLDIDGEMNVPKINYAMAQYADDYLNNMVEGDEIVD